MVSLLAVVGVCACSAPVEPTGAPPVVNAAGSGNPAPSSGSGGTGTVAGSGGAGMLTNVSETGNVTERAGEAGEGGAGESATDAGGGVVTSPPEGPVVVDPGFAGDGDFSIDTFAIQPDLTNRGQPVGRTFTFVMDSTTSVIFDGSDATLQPGKPRLLTRNIVVYVPAQYTDGTPAPILVFQDGPGAGQQNGQFDAVKRALDNLTISPDPARRIPAFIAIAVQNGGNDAQGSERGLEYDTLSDRYARFIELEVLPAVLADAQIRAAYPGLAITPDPEGKAAMGCSSGGAAAFTMAWFRPDLFRRAITYSGTFVAQQDNGQPEFSMYPLGAWEYHSSTNLIANTDPPRPIRVFLNVNGMDNGYNAPENGYHNWVLANQYMAAALRAKNYHYRFVTAAGIGHCDARAWQSTLADTLVWAWAGYPTN
jgi:enterochelin esterase-like enzyme